MIRMLCFVALHLMDPEICFYKTVHNCFKINNYIMTVNKLLCMYIISATCFDLTVDHHQALQNLYSIKGIHKKLPIQNQDLSFTKFYHVSLLVWFIYKQKLKQLKIGNIDCVNNGKVGDSLHYFPIVWCSKRSCQ